MDVLVAGFWGAFFGSVALMLAGSLAAFARSLQRVALTAALSALVSALFVVAYLGWLPITDPAAETRLLAHIAVLTAVTLGLMLLAMLGVMRHPTTARRVRGGMFALATLVLGAGWALDAAASLALSSIMAFGVGAAMFVTCVRNARRGDRLAWVAVSGVACMLVAVTGLGWIALHRDGVSWLVHAVTAVASMAYLAARGRAALAARQAQHERRAGRPGSWAGALGGAGRRRHPGHHGAGAALVGRLHGAGHVAHGVELCDAGGLARPGLGPNCRAAGDGSGLSGCHAPEGPRGLPQH